MLGVGAVQREIPQLQALTRTDTGATTTIPSRDFISCRQDITTHIQADSFQWMMLSILIPKLSAGLIFTHIVITIL